MGQFSKLDPSSLVSSSYVDDKYSSPPSIDELKSSSSSSTSTTTATTTTTTTTTSSSTSNRSGNVGRQPQQQKQPRSTKRSLYVLPFVIMFFLYVMIGIRWILLEPVRRIMAQYVSGVCWDEQLILQNNNNNVTYTTNTNITITINDDNNNNHNNNTISSSSSRSRRIPRILFLGDSISRGTFVRLVNKTWGKSIYLEQPEKNCKGFDRFLGYQSMNASVMKWLGSEKWDYVQMNIGMHFHPERLNLTTGQDWRPIYRMGILKIIHIIHQHDPQTKIVLALTTPSPLDTNATYPKNDSSCPHFAKFHKEGFVSNMNDVIRSIVQENDGGTNGNSIPGLWGMNDRYSHVVTDLIKYQMPCNIHFTDKGYRHLARKDWSTIVSALNLTMMNNDIVYLPES